jgi:methylated-DNA-[protein]-cysteine S-methyltransferase
MAARDILPFKEENSMKTTSVAKVSTRLGEFTVRCSERGVQEIAFGNGSGNGRGSMGHAPGSGTQKRGDPTAARSLQWARRAAQELKEYAAGERRRFTVPLDVEGTSFQEKVWKALRTIPYGETRSYGEIARQVGNPRAARAVGMANHENPIAVMVPCHRVIAGDGSLGGYAGGLAKKSRLLELERSRP